MDLPLQREPVERQRFEPVRTFAPVSCLGLLLVGSLLEHRCLAEPLVARNRGLALEVPLPLLALVVCLPAWMRNWRNRQHHRHCAFLSRAGILRARSR